MIKTVSVERRFCDFCGNQAYEWTACLGCGKDLCPEGTRDSVSKPHGVRYSHSVNCSGSYDGCYCVPCDIQLSESRSDLLYNAYSYIRQLRDEQTKQYERQQATAKQAEENLMRLRGKRGL